MTRVVVAGTADGDIGGILTYLGSIADKAVALRYNSEFEKLYDRLAVHPASCPLRPVLGVDIRIGLIPPYVVIYRYIEIDDVVTILRIVHGRRKIVGALLGRKP